MVELWAVQSRKTNCFSLGLMKAPKSAQPAGLRRALRLRRYETATSPRSCRPLAPSLQVLLLLEIPLGAPQYNLSRIDAKVNYVPNKKSMVFARYSISPSFIFDPPALGSAGGDATGGGQNGNAFSRVQSVALGGSYQLTPAMLWDANAGYTRLRLNAENVDIGTNFGLDTLHIPGTNGADPIYGGIPAFQISSWANLGNANTGNPFVFRDNQYVANTNLSWIKERHDLRFGLEYYRSGINHFQPQGGTFGTPRGTFGLTEA